MSEAEQVAPKPATKMRLISPAGFLLALMLFLFLPFLAASCDLPADSASGRPAMSDGVSYTGAELAIRQHTISSAAPIPGEAQEAFEQGLTLSGATQVLAIATIAVLALGCITSLLRTRKVHALTAVVISGIGLILLVLTEFVAVGKLTDILAPVPGTLGAFGVGDQSTNVADYVHVKLGFWLSGAALLAVLLLNVFVALRRGQRPPGVTKPDS